MSEPQSTNEQIDRLVGRISFQSDLTRRLALAVDAISPGAITIICEQLAGALDARPGNPAAQAGYQAELDKLVRLNHRRTDQDPAQQ